MFDILKKVWRDGQQLMLVQYQNGSVTMLPVTTTTTIATPTSSVAINTTTTTTTIATTTPSVAITTTTPTGTNGLADPWLIVGIGLMLVLVAGAVALLVAWFGWCNGRKEQRPASRAEAYALLEVDDKSV
jgi:hypothetical protein